MATYCASVKIGPVSNAQADEVLTKCRAYGGNLPVGRFMVGTETLYFDVLNLASGDRVGAHIVAMTFVMAVFGAGTGLVKATTVREVA